SLGGDDDDALAGTDDPRLPEAGAGAENRDGPARLGPPRHERRELVRPQIRDARRGGLEVVDEHDARDPRPSRERSRLEPPRQLGDLRDALAHRPRDAETGRARTGRLVREVLLDDLLEPRIV